MKRLGINQKLHILNMGAGVESCAIWAEWYFNPASRPFESWDQLIVIMSQTGDEHLSTKHLMERYILPQMAELGVRFIQVAKPKKGYSSLGYVVLEDSNSPETLHIRHEHIHALSSDLGSAGTVQARSSVHHCAQKHKGIPIDNFTVDHIYYEFVNPPKAEDLGYVVLDDSRIPSTLIIQDGRIKSLSGDLGEAGTIQMRSADHFCAIERKGKILDRMLVDLIYHEIIAPPATSLAADLSRLRELGLTHAKGGIPLSDINACYRAMCDGRGRFPKPGTQKYRRALVSLIDSQLSIGPYIGYNANETDRVEKSSEYTFRGVTYLYPLVEWGWSRAYCLYKLWHHYGVIWKKSACWHCPYCKGSEAAQRWITEPMAGAKTLYLEHKALILNPAMELYNGGSALEWAKRGYSKEAIRLYEEMLEQTEWQIWWVRRTITETLKTDKKGQIKTSKAIKRCTQGHGLYPSHSAALAALARLAQHLGRPVTGDRAIIHQRHEMKTPDPDKPGTVIGIEGLITVAPSDIQDKVQYPESFERAWAICGGLELPRTGDL